MGNLMYYNLLLIIVQVCLSSTQPKIIIIGAGPAGIAAATYLFEHNLTNFQILEAESRIGGRINTVKFGNDYVDLGAQWCMGRQGNVVYEKVKELNLLDDTEILFDSYYSSNKRIDDQLQNDLNDIIEDISVGIQNQPYENRSLGEVFNRRYNKLITEKFSDEPEKLKVAQNSLDFYHLATLSEEGAFSWFDIALEKSIILNTTHNPALNWKGKGYKTILNVLMKKIPDSEKALPIEERILLKKEVKKIIWNRNETQIICSDKTVYITDHVIFTPSLGVLKAEADKIFEPNLPNKKIEAINKVGFGAVMKIWLYYPEPWWKNVSQFTFAFIWSQEDIKSVSDEFLDGPKLDGRSWVTYIFALVLDQYNPNVASAWIVGPLVPKIELLSEDVIKNGINFILNRFLSNGYELTNFTKILPTYWYNNPHFKGTYSYHSTQTCTQSIACIDGLTEPLINSNNIPVIHFAGEATSKEHYGTVHGAIESGYREAKILVDLINN